MKVAAIDGALPDDLIDPCEFGNSELRLAQEGRGRRVLQFVTEPLNSVLNDVAAVAGNRCPPT
jgi:hypothetical protein